jgi:hypothetical protein
MADPRGVRKEETIEAERYQETGNRDCEIVDEAGFIRPKGVGGDHPTAESGTEIGL